MNKLQRCLQLILLTRSFESCPIKKNSVQHVRCFQSNTSAAAFSAISFASMSSAGSQHSEPEDNLRERKLADGTSNLSHSTSYNSRSSSSSPGTDVDRVQTRADRTVAPSFDAPAFDSAGVRSASATYVSSSNSRPRRRRAFPQRPCQWQ